MIRLISLWSCLRIFRNVKAKQLTDYKVNVLEGLKEAVNEVNLIKEGKLKGISVKDLLNEL